MCRTVGLALACILAWLVEPALAQNCASDPGKLGTSRTVTIDTSSAPRFGAQYRTASLLKEGEVALTFDDGPSRAYTRPILEALAEHCVKATFFMVGRMAMADPEMVKEVARQGHTIATHTWSHANLHRSANSAEAEIELGISAVSHALGRPIAPFFRFPYLRDTSATLGHLSSRNIAIFSIDVDSKDYLTRSPTVVTDRVLRGLAAQRRGIILFHDIHASTARALPTILKELKARHFRVVHLRPATDAVTVAAFDAQLAQQASRPRAASPALAKRSVTWPATVLNQGQNRAPEAARPIPRPTPADDWMSNVWKR